MRVLNCIVFMFLILALFSCKKENNANETITPVVNTPNTTASDFTITSSAINYPIGTTWAYNVVTVDEKYVNMSSANPNLAYSYTTPATYTVTVIKDSLITSGITAKILQTSASGFDNINTYVREVVYYNPSDLKWHDIVYEKYNGGPQSIECLGINLPLTSASAWQNTHSSHPSTGIDSCFARGFDNISCGLGSVKCIKFENKYTGTVQNAYWYNNLYGKVKAQISNYIFDNGAQTLTTKSSTITLNAFYN